MIKNKRLILNCAVLLMLASCASYQAASLTMLPETPAMEPLNNSQVSVSWKVYDEDESKTYLGRNLLNEGYIPVQLTIHNRSTDPVFLSSHNFNIPLAPANQVAEKAHTSTAVRVIGWGVPGLIIWPFLIPAVFDGIKSSEANSALDADYQAKSLKEQTIQPHSQFNCVVFVPEAHKNQKLEMFLVNQRTQEKVACRSIVCNP